MDIEVIRTQQYAEVTARIEFGRGDLATILTAWLTNNGYDVNVSNDCRMYVNISEHPSTVTLVFVQQGESTPVKIKEATNDSKTL